LAGNSNAPRSARRYVADALAVLGAPGPVVEAAELITSELVTNAVKYGCSPRIRVALTTGPAGAATITVTDTTPYAPLPAVPAESAQVADPERENGRGLFLVQALSTRWGHCGAGTAPADGTSVWAELDWNTS
jgi:anti-sigma regulatory factor (Ser/Thr protein kinase)